MDLPWAIHQLTMHSASITQLCLAVSDEQARRKPDAQSWSILEVINHLYDEERDDFRVRLDLTLYRPETPWPSNSPDARIASGDYLRRELRQSVADFAAERERSIEWLQTLQTPDWDRGRTSPDGKTLRAGDLLASWVAHDVLHLRQLVELHLDLATVEAQPYSIAYASD